MSAALTGRARRRARTYREESLLLIALLRTLWWLSYQDTHDWLADWPALALACGLSLDRAFLARPDNGSAPASPERRCQRRSSC